MDDNKTIDMEINADTTELDEAIDKAETLQEALALPKDGGVMLLGPGLEFCGVMPRDAEIEVIRKAADDD